MHKWWWIAPGHTQPLGSMLEMAVLRFSSPTEWEAVYILGKKSAWDAGGLAAKNTHDGNFFDQDIKKAWWRVEGGESICMPPKENLFS